MSVADHDGMGRRSQVAPGSFILPVIAMAISAAILFTVAFCPALRLEGDATESHLPQEHLPSCMSWQIFHWGAFHWSEFTGCLNWIAGSLLALAWFSRSWTRHWYARNRRHRDRSGTQSATPTGEPRVSIIVRARNEEEDIRETLCACSPRLLELRSDRRTTARPTVPERS